MRLKTVIALLTVTTFTGCDLNNYWGNGSVETRKIELNTGIDHIKANSTFEITLIQDSSSFIDVICNENYQPKVDIKIDSNTLILDNRIDNRWLNGYQKIKLEIHVPYIPVINIYKPCKVETRGTFKSDMFYLVDWGTFADCNVTVDVNLLCIHSSGDSFGLYIVNGKSVNTVLYCGGSANYSLKNFYTDSCFLSQDSILDLILNVTSDLEVLIRSSGNVYYRGNPTINLIRKGDGKLIKQ